MAAAPNIIDRAKATRKLAKRYGPRLKRARIDADLSQTELADALGCTQRTVCRYEAGQVYPNADRLALITEKLGIVPEA